MINDLTSGNPLRLIVLFSIPLLIGNIFQQFYNIADIVIVGRTLGIDALASVGAVAPLYFLIFASILNIFLALLFIWYFIGEYPALPLR